MFSSVLDMRATFYLRINPQKSLRQLLSDRHLYRLIAVGAMVASLFQ